MPLPINAEMHPDEFDRLCSEHGMTLNGFSRLTGRTRHSFYAWRAGRRPIPGEIAVLLRLLTRLRSGDQEAVMEEIVDLLRDQRQ